MESAPACSCYSVTVVGSDSKLDTLGCPILAVPRVLYLGVFRILCSVFKGVLVTTPLSVLVQVGASVCWGDPANMDGTDCGVDLANTTAVTWARAERSGGCRSSFLS